jgi:hypothetical protein
MVREVNSRPQSPSSDDATSTSVPADRMQVWRSAVDKLGKPASRRASSATRQYWGDNSFPPVKLITCHGAKKARSKSSKAGSDGLFLTCWPSKPTQFLPEKKFGHWYNGVLKKTSDQSFLQRVSGLRPPLCSADIPAAEQAFAELSIEQNKPPSEADQDQGIQSIGVFDYISERKKALAAHVFSASYIDCILSEDKATVSFFEDGGKPPSKDQQECDRMFESLAKKIEAMPVETISDIDKVKRKFFEFISHVPKNLRKKPCDMMYEIMIDRTAKWAESNKKAILDKITLSFNDQGGKGDFDQYSQKEYRKWLMFNPLLDSTKQFYYDIMRCRNGKVDTVRIDSHRNKDLFNRNTRTRS